MSIQNKNCPQKKILIIGSESFLGKALIEDLFKVSNTKISVVFRSASEERILFYEQHQITIYQGDLLQQETLLQMETTFDYVYYLASATYPANSWRNPREEIDLNLIPFFNFMNYVETYPPGKIIYTSSAGTVYGLKIDALTEDKLTRPFSPYGIFKVTMEHLLEYLLVKKNIAYDVYRISNLYGPGQNPKKGQGVINIWIRNILESGKITVFGDGSNVRDYIYIKDASRLLLQSLKESKEVEGRIFNLGTNKGYDLNAIISILINVISFNFKVDYKLDRKSDNKYVVVDSSKLLSQIPDFKFTSLEEGIQATVLNMQQEMSEIKKNEI